MYYTIYKTTNIINGKFYIGKHKTKNLNDGYIGSGKRLKYAIDKYGIDNFHTEILHICRDEKHMNLLEKILVVPDAETNYNLCPGGQGGFGYINGNLPNGMLGKSQSEKQKQKAKESILKIHSLPEYSQKISDAMKRRYETHSGTFSGKKHSQEYKDKMSRIMKIKSQGQGNSQYGTCWITNGIENKKIKKEELDSWIGLGYTKGRKMGP